MQPHITKIQALFIWTLLNFMHKLVLTFSEGFPLFKPPWKLVQSAMEFAIHSTQHLHHQRAWLTYPLGLLHHSDILHYVPSTIWHHHRGHPSFLSKTKVKGAGWRKMNIMDLKEYFLLSLDCACVWACAQTVQSCESRMGAHSPHDLHPGNVVFFVMRT